MKELQRINRLVAQIKAATANVPTIPPSANATASTNCFLCGTNLPYPSISLETWTGIRKVQLPPESTLSDDELCYLLPHLKTLLTAYNCSVIFQVYVPERVQYRVIRAQFHQSVPIHKDVYFSFSLCDTNQNINECIMSATYCHCRLLDNFFEKYATSSNEQSEQEEDIEEFRNYILEKRFGKNWRHYLGLNEEF